MGWFSRVFGGGGSKQVTVRPKGTLDESQRFKSGALSSEVAAGNTGDTYKMPMPENTEAMAGLIKNHKKGDRFPYTSVTGREEEPKDARLGRLRNFAPLLGKSTAPVMKIPTMELTELTSLLPLDIVMRKKLKKPFVRVRQITGLFTPLMSATSEYTTYTVSLMDDRFPDGRKQGQCFTGVSNQESPIEVSCDYCVPLRDLGRISIIINLQTKVLDPGFAWGAAYMEVTMEEADHPFVTPKKEVMGQIRTPYTTLEDRKVNPDALDLTITGEEVTKTREMYRDGDIADVDEPITAMMKANTYSKSTLRGGVQGPAMDLKQGDWDLSSRRKPNIPADQVSEDPESEGEETSPGLQASREWQKQQEKTRREMQNRGVRFQPDSPEGEGSYRSAVAEEVEDDEVNLAVSAARRNLARQREARHPGALGLGHGDV